MRRISVAGYILFICLHPDSIEQIAKAKQKGLPITVETAQHYLYFNAEQIRMAKHNLNVLRR